MGSSHSGDDRAATAAEYEALCRSYDRRTQARQISADDALAQRDAGAPIIWIDTRSAAEHAVSSIPRSRLHEVALPRLLLGTAMRGAAESLHAISTDATIICACTAGLRSGWAAVELEKRLGRRVYSLHGGIVAWANAGGEVTRCGVVTDRVHTCSAQWGRFLFDGRTAVW
jgi:rhodanese-related sulfurtransferase